MQPTLVSLIFGGKAISPLRSTYLVAGSYTAGVGIHVQEVHVDRSVTYLNCHESGGAYTCIILLICLCLLVAFPRHIGGAWM